MNKYHEFILLGFKKILIYKWLILILILKNFIYIFLQYSLWLAIKNNSSMNINIQNILAYFLIIRGLNSINFNVSQSMSYDVKQGNIINILCKPIEIHKYYFFDILGNTLAKVMTILFFNFLIAFIILKITNIVFIIQTILLIILAYILNFVLELILGTFSFFTQSIWGIDSLKDILLLILSGAFFPIYYYPKWLLKFIDYTPFSYVYGKVAEFAIQKQNFLYIASMQILFIVVLYFVYKFLLKICLNKLSINGG